MNIRIVDGYLEIQGKDGLVSISVAYVGGHKLATNEILRAFDMYHDFRESTFDWPDMWWDEDHDTWRYFENHGSDSPEYELQQLNHFIKECRRNQKCLVN